MTIRARRWRLPLPRSMAGQTMLLLVVGLTLTHAVSMLFYSHDRDTLLAATGGREFAHRAAVVVEMIAAVPAAQRPQLVEAAKATDLDVSLSPQNPLVREHESDWRGAMIRQLLGEELGPELASRTTVQVFDPDPEGGFGLASLGPTAAANVRASIGLGDGSYISVTGALPVHGMRPSGGALASTLVMAGAVLALSLVAVRRMTGPLRRLALAAERLGRDVAAPPLDEGGPDEVRRAAIAFNGMQARLRRFVEDRTQMLAAISHDLRTPITLLRLRAELIEDEGERGKTLATLDEMEEMIRSTLAFARQDAEGEPMQRVDLGALIQSLCDDLAEVGRPVSCAEPPSLVLSCRPQALRRALGNLIENAARYGHRAEVAVEEHPGAVLIHVDDEGPGIPENRIDEVFRPFYRLEGSRARESGGVGLGLSIVASVAYAHGGDIALANRDGGGLRATLRLPR
ncbi:ATP-binding protein [Consotaella salsifontis]|uniref:histidine kinase n=1 Tax=Consotaella salsifontis TaxID=1365950 RepID=A0A1T4RMM0_9HYPH|nr:ATP-binding protein [Consotaella salsifontis]SKA17212.1 Signal transduction histidine kinase [Consotaella salsifontis]